MAADRVSFSHLLPTEMSSNEIARFAELFAEELTAKELTQTDQNRFRLVFFDVNVDHDIEFEVISKTGKVLVNGSIGLDADSSTNETFFSNAAWGLIGLAFIVGLIADSILWGAGAAVVIALIDQASGEDQKTRALVIDAIDRAYVKLYILVKTRTFLSLVKTTVFDSRWFSVGCH